MRKYLFKAINKDTDTSSLDAVLVLPFTCSNSTVDDVNDVLLMSLLLTGNMFRNFFKCFYYWVWISKCLQGPFLFWSGICNTN